MAARTTYRDPSTGRFISREQAEEIGEVIRMTISGQSVTQQPFSFHEPEEGDFGPEADPYDLEPSRWGGRMHDPDGSLDEDRLGSTDFPSGYDSFRVTYVVDGNPKYRKGFASSEWMSPSMWPPDLDMLEGVTPDAIGHIVFRRSQ